MEKNFLSKYLILELFEKLYRLKKFISTCETFDRKNNTTEIVKLFNNSIEIIGNEINGECALVNFDLSENDEYALISRISENYRAITKIHEELKNLHSSWILPEIKTFVRDVVKPKPLLNEDINIILSDNYSFLERNLGIKFQASLQDVYSHMHNDISLGDSHSFILPKIEYSNPLNWTIVVHEAGHLQNDVIDDLINPNTLPDGIGVINGRKVKSWIEELYCDVYATSVLGPAYFLSFVTFALLSTVDYGISASSDNHPSVMIRASWIHSYLKNNNLVFRTEWGLDDYAESFYGYLIHQDDIFNDGVHSDIAGLTKFNRNLRKQIKDLNLNGFDIKMSDSENIQKLVLNLHKGMPIGNICDTKGFDTAVLDGELTSEDINQIKKKISERPCTIWEILNAGWVYKIQYNLPKGSNIFFSEEFKDYSILQKINEYGTAIDFLDERLLSSINTSQIIKIIEQNGIDR